MDALNNLIEQTRDLFRSMSPGARITAALLVAVVGVSVAMLFKQTTAGPDEYLFGGEPLSRGELLAIQAAVGQAGLDDFQLEGSRIRVPRAQRAAYLAAIADAGATPVDAKGYMNAALDGGSVFDSREVKQQRIKSARERELSHVIGLMPWVDSASVMVDERVVPGPRASTAATAVVHVKPLPGEGLDPRRARNLQKLVAGGFSSMKPDMVTVVNLGTDETFGGADDVFADDFERLIFRERVRWENYVRGNIQQRLSYIPGLRVQVNADLDTVLETERQETKPDPQTVASSELDEREKTTVMETPPLGPPGQQTNSAQGPPGAGTQTAQAAPKSQTERSTTSTQNVTGFSQTREVTTGLKPKEVHASVGIPRDYVVEVWKNRKLEAGEELPEKIDENDLKLVQEQVRISVENAVKPLLPNLNLGKDDFSQVHVTFYEGLPAAEVQPPSIATEALAWGSQYAGTLGMVGMAVFSLLTLRSITRGGGGTGSGPAAAPSGLRVEAEKPAKRERAEEEDDDEEGRPRLKLRKADSLKDDLVDMVREDPDGAAAILKGWISNAG